MKGKAMSNETDLDWLALVLHKWPDGDGITLLGRGCSFFDTGVGRAVHVYAVDGSDYTAIKEKDWLARRAELQNKPSWETHEYKVIAQGRNGSWYGSNYGEEKFGHESSFCIMGTGWNCICRGVALGDWRDTLEKRPEQAEFEPFISIEDSQEKEMKQDNKWFERGELPPVGVECEAKKYGKEEWYKVVICGAGKHLGLAVAFYEKQKGSGAFTCSSAEYFRPIRTEREVLIEIIKKTDDTDDKIADAILAAGFSLRGK